METNLGIILGVLVGLEIISLLFSALLIYCSLKVQPISKPPGSLVLVEMILISLTQLFRVASTLAWQLSESEPMNIRISIIIPLRAVGLYCTITNSHYEICIIFELYLRLRVRKNNQSFKKRAIIYHGSSHFLTICIIAVMVVGYITIEEGDRNEYALLDYTKWLFWFTISYFAVNLIILVIIASMTSYKSSKLQDSGVKRFIDKLIKYMIVLVIVRVITILLLTSDAVVIDCLDHGKDRILIVNFISIFLILMNTIPYIVRMFDPHIKEFLKHKVRTIKYRMKDKMNEITGRRRLDSSINISMNLIPVRKLFDDILIENIEYRFIALAIAMLKSHDNHDDL
jgi:hypothetical protein